MSSSLPDRFELSKMKELNLFSKDWLGDSHAKYLAKLLAINVSLTFVGFRECRNLGDSGIVALAEALRQNKSITKLTLESTGCGDRGAKALARALLDSESMSRLDLNYCKISDVGATALAEALALNPPGLKYLSMDHCKQITDKSVGAFVAALEVNTVVTEIGLKGTSISGSGKAQIAAMLKPTVAIHRRCRSDISATRSFLKQTKVPDKFLRPGSIPRCYTGDGDSASVTRSADRATRKGNARRETSASKLPPLTKSRVGRAHVRERALAPVPMEKNRNLAFLRARLANRPVANPS